MGYGTKEQLIDQFMRVIEMRKWRVKDIPILDVPPRLMVVV